MLNTWESLNSFEKKKKKTISNSIENGGRNNQKKKKYKLDVTETIDRRVIFEMNIWNLISLRRKYVKKNSTRKLGRE